MSATVLHRFTPYGAALDLFKSKAPEVLVAGPAGTGKSRACMEKLHQLALRNGGMRGLIVRQFAASLTSTALKTWEADVVPHALADGSVWFHGGSSREPPGYRYSNGSMIAVGGLDKPAKIMSLEIDTCYVQEATDLSLSAWQALNTRMRHGRVSFQQVIADANPQAPTHWLKLRCDAGQTVMLHSRHEDNPRYFNRDGTMTEAGAAYMSRLDALTGVEYLRLRKGIWAAAEGVIYSDYDPSAHVVDPFRIPDSWERVWTVDFGFTHPFVLQCWAVDGDGRGYLYREIFRSKRLVEDHARDILALVTDDRGVWTEPKPARVVCDHDAEDRATLERHLGMPTVPARKNVSRGLQAGQARFKRAGDGRPRLFYVKGALVERDEALAAAGRPCSTLEEIPGYVWNAAKDAPVKDKDDGMDALRYFVADQDLGAEPRVRWLESNPPGW